METNSFQENAPENVFFFSLNQQNFLGEKSVWGTVPPPSSHLLRHWLPLMFYEDLFGAPAHDGPAKAANPM